MYLLVCICVLCIVYTLVAFAYVGFSVIHLSHTCTDCIVGLLLNSTMYICIGVTFVLFFLMLNDIRPFPICVTIFLCVIKKFLQQFSLTNFTVFYHRFIVFDILLMSALKLSNNIKNSVSAVAFRFQL